VTAPRQPDLFSHVEQTIIRIADEVAAGVPQSFDFLADGEPIVPGSLEDVPEWLRIPLVDSPDWMPAPAVGRRG
jgi:hypothetical protein